MQRIIAVPGHFLSGKHGKSSEHTCDQNKPHGVLINAGASNFGNSKFKLGADTDRTDQFFCVGSPPVNARKMSCKQHDASPQSTNFTLHSSINQSIDDTSIWTIVNVINPLKLKPRPLYLKTQSVPHCKHFSSRL